MSVTTSIGCKKCKVSLWIGQGYIIYTGEPSTMEALRHFLYEHINHHLVFYNENEINDFNESWNENGYKDFDGDEYVKYFKLNK